MSNNLSTHKHYRNSIFFLIIGFCIGRGFDVFFVANKTPIELDQNNVEMYFTKPKGERKGELNFIQIETKIIEWIDKAQESIYMHIYAFTSIDIMRALLRAQERNVEVHIIADKQFEYVFFNTHKPLVDSKVDIKIRRIHGISHIKAIAIDKEYYIVGSYNYTAGANNKNDEVILFVHSAKLTQEFLENWNKIYEKSTPIACLESTDLLPSPIIMYGTEDKVEIELLDTLMKCETSIWMSLHSVPNERILTQILKAMERGVQVQIISYSNHITSFLREYGIINIKEHIFKAQKESKNMSEIIIDNKFIFHFNKNGDIKISRASIDKKVQQFNKHWI